MLLSECFTSVLVLSRSRSHHHRQVIVIFIKILPSQSSRLHCWAFDCTAVPNQMCSFVLFVQDKQCGTGNRCLYSIHILTAMIIMLRVMRLFQFSLNDRVLRLLVLKF